MELESSGIIFSREEWLDLKSSRKQFIWELIFMTILLMIFLSMIVNGVLITFDKIKPNLNLTILVFIVQPIFLAVMSSFITLFYTYKLNTMVHDLKEKDKDQYKKYFTIIKGADYFSGAVVLFINVESLTSLCILSLIGLFIAIIFSSVLIARLNANRKFHVVYEEILAVISQEENKNY